MNLFRLLGQSADCWPSRAAVFFGMELVWTYAQLRERALRLANGLRSHYAPGERIAIVSQNCPEYVESLFAIWAAGLVAVPVNAKLHVREIAEIAADCRPVAVLASPKIASAIREASLPPLVACDLIAFATDAYCRLLDRLPGEIAEVAGDDLAWIFYTSGTTGRSKGAMLSHRNLLAMTISHLADVDDIDESHSQIQAAPMSHGSGLYLLPYVARGAAQVIPASGAFQPEEFLDLCDGHSNCGAFLAPTMVQRLRRTAAARPAAPTNLRTIVYGGGPMYVEELRKAIATFGQVFVQIYGQGESPMTITWLPRDDHRADDPAVLGSVGRARTGTEVRVVDEEGDEVAHGQTGEIVCRGDIVMRGYWGNVTASQETLRSGWLRTGDIGSFDARGYLTLRDRSKDVIISGGSNIYPREVEEVLLRYQGVAEACVVGEPDPEWGESVVAFVVRETGSVVREVDLDAHCLEQIARFKRPARYQFVASLPKNSYGKVLRRELRLSRPEDPTQAVPIADRQR